MSPYVAVSTLAKSMPKSVLDVGSGNGASAIEFLKAGCKVTAIDPNPLNKANPLNDERIHFEQTSLEEYVVNEPFDLVIAKSVSHRVEYSVPEFLTRLKSLITKDGLIYVSLLGNEDEWADIPAAKTLSFDIVLDLIAAQKLSCLHRSITWHYGKTHNGRAKYWHYYRFILTPRVSQNTKSEDKLYS